MRKKHDYLKQKVDKKMLFRNYLFRALVAFMVIVVLYDSFIHNTPLYYVCYYFLGLFIGKIFSIADRVKHSGEDQTFTVASSPYSIITTLLLLSIRFVWGRQLLEFAHVVWTTDALYLIFIGIYWSKWKSIIEQMDDIIYGWFSIKQGSSDISGSN
jgi:hypothetical protein